MMYHFTDYEELEHQRKINTQLATENEMLKVEIERLKQTIKTMMKPKTRTTKSK